MSAHVSAATLLTLLSSSYSAVNGCRPTPPGPTPPPIEEEEEEMEEEPPPTGSFSVSVTADRTIVAPGGRIVFTVTTNAPSANVGLPEGTTFEPNGSTFSCVGSACDGTGTLAVLTDASFRGDAHLEATVTGGSASIDVPVTLRALDESFDGAGSLATFTDHFPALHQVFAWEAGRLILSPNPVANNHWYADSHGPFIGKRVTGNFVVEVHVRASRQSDPTQPPAGDFTAAGFVVRDPASTAGSERWVMYNVGWQQSGIAREAKTTRPGGGGSISNLFLNATATAETTLRICRVGDTFRFFHDGVEEHYDGATVAGGTIETPPTGPLLRFERPDLPATLDIGLIAGAWSGTLDLRGEFDDQRFGDVDSSDDCEAEMQ